MSFDKQDKPEDGLLDIKNLSTRFYTVEGTFHAVNGISYTLKKGGTLGVVGESGCGKSVHALSIMRLVPSPAGRIEGGEIWFDGRDLLKLSTAEMRKIRGAQIAMIFQDPMASLNPVLTVGFQIMEAIKLHQKVTKAEARERAGKMLTMVGIPEAEQRLGDYPHQFSGGMRQRAMIAMALSCHPKLLIADEPTTALDVTIQAQIIDLVKELQEKLGMAVIWITHDLGVVARLAKEINVMYAGSIVERGTVKDIYKRPRHPYTRGLLGSLPRLDDPPGTKLVSIPGMPPDLIGLKAGCPFSARCMFAEPCCWEKTPTLMNTDEENHTVACFRWKAITERKE